MLVQKRIIWLILIAIAAASISLFISTRQSRGEANIQPPQRITMKVLRRQDQLHVKPTAKEVQDNQPPPEERVLDDQIPKNVPIKIKIRKEKEKAFKDLKNEAWDRDFELEVTNTGNKPIYQLYFLLITDIKANAGYRILTTLDYGRTELGTISTLATPDDIPIKPGESIILKIHPGQILAWDIKTREEHRALPKKIQIKFQTLSFGDGTGYGPGGIALPRNLIERSGLDRCLDLPNKSDPGLQEWTGSQSDQRPSTHNAPASILPVNFLSVGMLRPISFKLRAPQDCCLGNDCMPLIPHREHVCVNCPIRNDPRQPIAATLRELVLMRISATTESARSTAEGHMSVK